MIKPYEIYFKKLVLKSNIADLLFIASKKTKLHLTQYFLF